MNRRKRRSHTTHQVVVSPEPLLSDSEHKIFTLKLAFKHGRAQISVHIMRSVIRLRKMITARVEFTRREIGFMAKDR
jgi:hypothetical protein